MSEENTEVEEAAEQAAPPAGETEAVEAVEASEPSEESGAPQSTPEEGAAGGSFEPDDSNVAGIDFVLDPLLLMAGDYVLELNLMDSNGLQCYDRTLECLPFSVRQGTYERGLVQLPHRWDDID